MLWDVWGLFRPLAGGLHHSRLVSIRIRHLFITSFCYISLMCNCKMFYATQFLPLPWESRHIFFGHIYRAILSGFSYTALHRLIVGTNTCNLQVIYQTRETVFHQDIQTPRRELKIRRAAEYF